ncbi:MAG: hypothetical protein JKX70_04655, partial [Phycisphaerales bacterium]|nr:hypothetical protein [Phycisphaerales bacterium]
RAVASYLRKGGTEEVMLTLDDVRASLPEEMIAMVLPGLETGLAEITETSDIAELQTQLEEMEAQKDMVPPQFQTAMKFMKQQIEQQIMRIESGEMVDESTDDSTEQGGDE